MKAHAWKVCNGESRSRVRIPLCPPIKRAPLRGPFYWRTRGRWTDPCSTNSATAEFGREPTNRSASDPRRSRGRKTCQSMFFAIPLCPFASGNSTPVTEFSLLTLAGIHDHSSDLRHGRSAVSIFRRLRARLAPAPIQQRLCRRQARAGRRIGIIHDFGQNRDRVGRVCARQGLDTFLVCFRSLHVSQVGGLEATDQSVRAA